MRGISLLNNHRRAVFCAAARLYIKKGRPGGRPFSLCFFSFLDFIYPLDDRHCKEVCRVGKEDGQNEQNDDVEDGAEDAESVHDGEAHVLDEADVALVKVVEVHLQRVGEDRRDGDVDGKDGAHYLHIPLRLQLVEAEGDRKHKVEDNEVMEGDGVKVAEGGEIVTYVRIGIDDRGHQKHIEHQRGKAAEGGGVGDKTMLSAVEGVEWEQVQKQTAIVERQGVKIVAAVGSDGVDLLHHLEHQEQDGNDLKRDKFNTGGAFPKQQRGKRRQNGKQDKGRYYLQKVCKCPKSHIDLPIFSYALIVASSARNYKIFPL